MNYATERLQAAAEASLSAWEGLEPYMREPHRAMIEELESALLYFDAHGAVPAAATQAGPVWIARYESRNFDFEAVGGHPVEAMAALRTGLAVHARQYGLADDWADISDVRARQVVPGLCERDGQPLNA